MQKPFSRFLPFVSISGGYLPNSTRAFKLCLEKFISVISPPTLWTLPAASPAQKYQRSKAVEITMHPLSHARGANNLARVATVATHACKANGDMPCPENCAQISVVATKYNDTQDAAQQAQQPSTVFLLTSNPDDGELQPPKKGPHYFSHRIAPHKRLPYIPAETAE